MLGQTIAHYRVLEKLGSGGMGVVYKAEDTNLRRQVALKFLSPELSQDQETMQRFQREACAASSLNHPFILTIYEFGSADNTQFIASEFVQGSTLRELLKGRLTVDQSLRIAEQVLEGLGAAHSAGIVHRDLKPENIMVRPDGYIKVMDFGIAKLLPLSPAASSDRTLSQHLTKGDTVIGTLPYVSPEQARGQDVDQRSDLFAFGIMLYEMLAGRHPWARRVLWDTVHAIIYEECPELPRPLERHLELQEIVEKALSKAPATRYQSAAEMRMALSGVRASSGVNRTIPSSPAQSSLAVLPFVFLSAVEEKEALSLGFADALITALGSQEALTVRPTSAILKYPGGTDPLRVSQELEVRHVLQGNVQKLGSQWRVSIQLFDTALRKNTLSERYDFNLGNVFEIQDEIGRKVGESLQQRFTSGLVKARDRYSTDPEAYGDYLKGLQATYIEEPRSLESAIECFSRAVKRDSEFALAHGMLSYVLCSKYFSFDPRRVWLDQAEAHCARALELDPNLPEGLMARGFLLWNPSRNFPHQAAIKELKRALSLQPNLDHAHNRLGTILAHIGLMDESRRSFENARRVNPQNIGHHNITQAYLWNGDFEKAAAELQKWGEARPNNRYTMWFQAQPPLLTGDLKTAAKFIAKAIQHLPDEPLVISLQGLLHAYRQEVEPALECVRRSCESPRSFGHTHHTYYQIACVYAMLGDTQKAMDWLERTADSGFPCWPFFRRDPSLHRLQGVAEFEQLVGNLEKQYSAENRPLL